MMHARLLMLVAGVTVGLCFVVAQDNSRLTTTTAPATASAPASMTATASGPAASTAPADSRKVIKVASVKELLHAIGPDRIIQLEALEYNLSDESTSNDSGEEAKDTAANAPAANEPAWASVESSLTIFNVENLRIEGLGDKRVRIFTNEPSNYVLQLQNSDNVELVNLELGHKAEAGTCDCGVVSISGCRGVTIRNCDLYGCGTEGLNIDNSRGLNFIKSTIRDCSNNILTAEQCKNFVFKDSIFVNNKQSEGFVLNHCENMRWTKCNISGNKFSESLFQTTTCGDLSVTDSTISNNEYKGLMQPAAAVKLDKVKTDGNTVSPEPPPQLDP